MISRPFILPPITALARLLAALGVAVALPAAGQSLDNVLTNGLVEPHSVAVDGSGILYLTDGGGFAGFGDTDPAHRVWRYDQTTGGLTILAGDFNGAIGTNENTVPNSGINARFFNPAGIVVARGGLVVADSGNHAVRFVGFNGVVTNIAGLPGTAGTNSIVATAGSSARFNTPIGLGLDAAGNIYVADSKNNVIRRIDPANMVTTYATNFNQPNGVAVGDNGEVWVADTLNNQIKVVLTNGTAGGIFTNVVLRAGSGTAGSINAFPDARNAQLNKPRGVLWMGAGAGLLIADTGNHVARRLFTNSATATYVIETSVGKAGEAGFATGTTNNARLNSPIGLATDVFNGAFLVVDSANAAVRRIQQTPAQPAITDPQIGTVSLITDPDTGLTGTVLTPITHSVFNNSVVIAILASSGVDTFFTFGTTPTNVFVDTVPSPSTGGSTAPSYLDGSPTLPATIIPTVLPDMTVKAQSSQSGRIPSGIVSARFQFKTANPQVVGDNAAQFTVTTGTSGAQIFYTTDGSEPTNGPPSIGPVSSPAALSFNLNGSNLVFQAKAFRTSFEPSGTVSNLFSPSNFVANRISFGFDSGEASSAFIAAAGSTFYAPVTLTTLSGQQMYSLQFGLVVNTNDTIPGQLLTNPGPAVAAGAIGYDTRLREQLPDGSLRPILPQMVSGFVTTFTTNGTIITTNVTATFTNLLATNSTLNQLSVGYLERATFTNLFNTTVQDLIKFSLAHDTLFDSANGKIVVGGFAFNVPGAATNGQQYRVSIIRPSATSDGVSQDVFIDAATNGSLTTASPINSIKTVTVGSPVYLVGDLAPFRWFNAGDFGNTNLLNNDVLQAFQSAVYGVNRAPVGSDYRDALDSCCGTATNDPPTGLLRADGGSIPTALIGSGDDLLINSSIFGDGMLDVRDVYVTFRRSLDPSLTNVMRFRSNGIHYAFQTTNVFRGISSGVAASGSARPRPLVTAGATAVADEPPFVAYAVGDVVATAGQTVTLPITANVRGGIPLRLLAFNLTVHPVDGSPRLTQTVQFTPAAGLGNPAVSASVGMNNYSAAWLNPSIAGLTGDSVIGHLSVPVPSGAGANAAYAVVFDHVSGSPNGLAALRGETVNGLITLSPRDASSLLDGISDAWRLKHFATLNNLLSLANADADGDGVPNWAEFRAGTNPNEPLSRLELQPGRLTNLLGHLTGLRLRFPTVTNRTYLIECSDALGSTNWALVAPAVGGTGGQLEFVAPPAASGPRFYRVRLQE